MSKAWKNDTRRGWRRKRQMVLDRDSHTCQRCGQSEGSMHVDHIVPRRLGGLDLIENLQTLCQFCNLSKGGRFFEEPSSPPTLHGLFVPQNESISHD
jgi:5-methylcytosine-specific restriction protein A